MLRKAWQILLPPNPPEDELLARQARLLHIYTLGLGAGLLLIALIIVPLFASQKIGSWLILGVSLIAICIVQVLLRRGLVRKASLLMTSASWLLGFLFVWLSGGMSSAVVVYLAMITIISGLLLGERGPLWITLASGLAGLLILFLDLLGYHPPQLFRFNQATGWAALMVSLSLTTAAFNYILRSQEQALALAKEQIKAREKVEADLLNSERRFRNLFDWVNDAVLVLDPVSFRIVDLNQRMCEIFGYSREAALDLPLSALASPAAGVDWQNSLCWIEKDGVLQEHLAEFPARTAGGLEFWMELNMRRVVLDGQDRLLVSARDITQRKENQAEVERMAVTDDLTGVFNRRQFFSLYHAAIANARQNRTSLAVIMVDLDNFKQLNDRYGHVVGDQSLVHIARIFSESLRTTDVLARYGGDEFVLFLKETNEKNALVLAERMRRQVLDQPLVLDNRTFQLSISAGIAVFDPDRDEDAPDQLLAWADQALYQAKERGRNCCIIYQDPGKE